MPEMNLYQKLAKIRKAVEVIKNNKRSYNYTYTDEEAILSRVTGLMDKYGISLIPGIVPGTTVVSPYHYKKTKATKDGKVYEENVNDILVSADTYYLWIDNEDPTQMIRVDWTMIGQQSEASQAFGSGLTYSQRYFLLKYFNISTTDDDPDAWKRTQKETEEAEQREIAAKIIEEVHGFVTTYLSVMPDDREKISAIITKYVKDGKKPSVNYNLIKDPVVAANLLKELRENFSLPAIADKGV